MFSTDTMPVNTVYDTRDCTRSWLELSGAKGRSARMQNRNLVVHPFYNPGNQNRPFLVVNYNV